MSRNILWIQSVYWCDENSHNYALKWALVLSFIVIQRTDKPSMKFFKRIHSLCFQPILNKFYGIYNTEDELIQPAAVWLKLRREAGTEEAESRSVLWERGRWSDCRYDNWRLNTWRQYHIWEKSTSTVFRNFILCCQVSLSQSTTFVDKYQLFAPQSWEQISLFLFLFFSWALTAILSPLVFHAFGTKGVWKIWFSLYFPISYFISALNFPLLFKNLL